ncbi:MAG: hypothetical protein ACLS6Q_07810 [Christensenellaceae bacterium]
MTAEKLIETVKNCGQSIIDNAESIVGDFDYHMQINVSFTVGMSDSLPEISVENTFIPENEIGTKCIAIKDLE